MRAPGFINALLRPSRIRLRRPLALDGDPALLRRLPDDAAPRSVTLLHVDPPLELSARAPLIGFAAADAEPSAALVEHLEAGGGPAELRLDPRAVVSPAPEIGAAPISVTLAARLAGAGGAEILEARFELAPPMAPSDAVDWSAAPRIERIADAVFDAALDDDPVRALAEIRLTRRPQDAAAAWRGEISVGSPQAPPGALSLRRPGDPGFGDGQRMAVALAAGELDGAIEIVGAFAERRDGQRLGWLREPDAPGDLELALRLDAAGRREEMRLSLPFSPRSGPRALDVEARALHPDAAPSRVRIALEPGAEDRVEAIELPRATELRADLDAVAGPTRRRVIVAELALRGRRPDAPYVVHVAPELHAVDADAIEEAPIAPDDALTVTVEPGAAARRGGAAAIRLDGAERRAEIALELDDAALARLSARRGQASFEVRLRLRVASAPDKGAAASTAKRVAREVVFRHDVHLSALTRAALALDVGSAAVAAAMAPSGRQPGDGARMIDLGAVLSRQDDAHVEAGSPFIESRVSWRQDECWRLRDWAPSLWAALDRGDARKRLKPDVASLLRSQDRRYCVALPPETGRRDAGKPLPGLPGPGAALASVDGRASVHGRELDATQLYGDALREIAEFYLPRAGALDAFDGAATALLRPNLLTPAHAARLERAGLRFAQALSGDGAAAPALIPEGDAAAAYWLDRFEATEAGSISLLAIDIGAANLDATLATSAPGGRAPLADRPRRALRRRLGARLGGDAINLLLYFIVSAALEPAAARQGVAIERPPLMESGASGVGAARHLEGKRRFAAAVIEAKHALSDACRGRADGLGWPADEPFVVQVGAVDEAEAWPLAATATLAEIDPRDATHLRRRGDRIELVLPKTAIERPAMRALMRAMTADILTLAAVDGAPPGRVALSGRGSQWPLIREALDAALAETPADIAVAPPSPPAAGELKRVAAFGALSLLRRPFDEDAPPSDLALALQHPDGDLTIHRLDQPERPLAAGAARLALWPQGLSVEASRLPWRHRLVALSDETVAVEAGATWRLEGNRLHLGARSLELERLAAPPGAALEAVDFDISPSRELAPPGWPESCAPDQAD